MVTVEQSQDAPGRVFVAGRLPARVRDDGQRGEARDEQHDVQRDLPARRELARRPVGIGVAEEQQELEEHEAGRPHRGGAAEPRQDLLRHDRLDEEQQERAREDRESVERHWLSNAIAERIKNRGPRTRPRTARYGRRLDVKGGYSPDKAAYYTRRGAASRRDNAGAGAGSPRRFFGSSIHDSFHSHAPDAAAHTAHDLRYLRT